MVPCNCSGTTCEDTTILALRRSLGPDDSRFAVSSLFYFIILMTAPFIVILKEACHPERSEGSLGQQQDSSLALRLTKKYEKSYVKI